MRVIGNPAYPSRGLLTLDPFRWLDSSWMKPVPTKQKAADLKAFPRKLMGRCGSQSQNNVNTQISAATDAATMDDIASQTGRRPSPPSPVCCPASYTTPALCLAPFGNDLHRLVGRQPSQVLVSHPAATATLFNRLTTHSQETTVRRCCENATRHCEGILRRVSTPQVVFGRHQRADQALRCASLSDNHSIPSTNAA